MAAISVIIPVYNVEEYIERCIRSLLNQTFNDIEMIFIDDCSTDNSIKNIKKYANKDHRIKIFCLEKISGAAIARNKGLEVASGEYLSFIDPDDAIDLNFYESLYKKAKATNADIVKCERRTYETDGSITYSNLNQRIKKRGNFFFGYEWTTAIYRSSLIKGNNIKFLPELIKAQDTAFLNKVLLKTTKSIEFVDNVYYNYYRRFGSLNAKELPVKYVKSAVLSQKIQCENLNCSNLYETNPNLYMELYVHRPVVLLAMTAFQNVEYEAKLICAQGVIDCYKACKNKKAFEELFPYKNFLKYIKNNRTKKFASILYKMKTPDELNDLSINFWQKIFSIKKSTDGRYKILRLLGVRFCFEINKGKR